MRLRRRSASLAPSPPTAALAARPTARPAALLASALVAVALLAPGCSSSSPDEVVIDDGSVPGDATTTSAPPTTSETVPASALGPPTLDDSSPVSTAGVGAVEFGMSVAEAEDAAGSRLVPLEGQEAGACYEAAFEDGPLGLQFTVADDTLERLDVVDGAVSTLSGAGIGDTTDQLDALFGDQLEPGADPDGDGDVLTFVPEDEGDAGTRIIFVIESDEVTSFRSGRRPIVDSGC